MPDLANMLGALTGKARQLMGQQPAAAPTPPAEVAAGADPYADTEAIVALVKKYRDEWGKKEIRDPMLKTAYRNILFARGIQWIRWRGGRWTLANVPKGVPTPVTNRFGSTMEAVISVYGRIEPQLNFRPGSPDEPADRATADVATRAITVIEDEVKIRMERQYLAAWVGYTGGAFLETGYDPDPVHGMRTIALDQCPSCQQEQPQGAPACEACGDTQPMQPTERKVPKGKMYTDVVPLFEAYFDPSITSWSKHKRFLREKAMSVEDAKERWPAIADQISPNVAGMADEHYMTALATQGSPLDERSTGRQAQSMGGGMLLNNRVTERWYWQMPNATYPEGLLAIVVGNGALAYAKGLPYWALGEDPAQDYFLPFVWFPQKLVPGTMMPKTVADDLALKQMQRNRWESALELCGMRMGMPIWLSPSNANVQGLAQGGGEAGAIIRYNALGPGSAKPERIPGQPIPMSFLEFIMQIDKDFEEIAACVVGNTRIPCLDGVTRTAEELAREYSDGGMWVYGFDCDTGKVVPSQIESAFKTGRKRCVRIVFREGTIAEVSHDHPFLTWDRGYVAAADLQPGDSLVPFTRSKRNGYVTVYQPTTGKHQGVHRMVAGSLWEMPRGAHVHHRDRRRDHNMPDNLEVLAGAEHVSHHASQWWREKSEEAKQRRIDPMLVALRAYWASLTFAERSARNLATAAKVSPEANSARIRAAVAGQKNMTAETRAAKRARQSEVMRAYWATKTPEERKAHGLKIRQNHKVDRVEDIGFHDVYDMQTTTLNFGLEAGVFTRNTYDVIKGARPEGISAGIALQILQERGMSRYGPLFIMWETAWSEWARQAIEIFRQFATEERLLKIKGRDGQWQVEKFIGADLQGRVDVIAEAGSSVPRSSLLDRAEMEQLIAMGGLPDPRANPEVQQKLLEVYGRENMLPGMSLDTKRAVMENEAFTKIAEMPIWQYASPEDVAGIELMPTYPEAVAAMTEWQARVPQMAGQPEIPWPKVYPALDGHSIHSREVGNLGKSETFTRFPRLIQAMVEKHKAFHDQLLIQQMAAIQGGGQIQGGFMQPSPGGAMPKQQTLNTSSSGARMGGDFNEMQGDVASGGNP